MNSNISAPGRHSATFQGVKYLLAAISAVRLVPHILVFFGTPQAKVMRADLDRWVEHYIPARGDGSWFQLKMFAYMMTYHPEYRSIFYFRIGMAWRLIGWLCPPLESLKINVGHCGPGLFIQHGFGTLISADSIGSHCSVNQLVTIGYVNNSVDRPSLGDNVTVSVGARILGRVKLGDNVKVGANTVVISDVPENRVAFGVPARILWSNANEPGKAS